MLSPAPSTSTSSTSTPLTLLSFPLPTAHHLPPPLAPLALAHPQPSFKLSNPTSATRTRTPTSLPLVTQPTLPNSPSASPSSPPAPPPTFKFASLPTSSSFPPRAPKTNQSRTPSRHISPLGLPRRPHKPTRPRLASDTPLAPSDQLSNIQIVRVPELVSRSALQPGRALKPLPRRLKNLERLLPVHVLERIFQFLPDAHGFPSTFRSRGTGYGFTSSAPCEPDPLLVPRRRLAEWTYGCECRVPTDESEGVWWPVPPLELRLVCRRWADVGAEVFFRHLSVLSDTRLGALALLFHECPMLASAVRTLVVALPPGPSPPCEATETARCLRLRALLMRLPRLRALALRGVVPTSMNTLPRTLVRFAIEFPRDDRRVRAPVVELASMLTLLPRGLLTLRLKGFHSQTSHPLATYVQRLEAGMASGPRPRLATLVLSDCRLSEADGAFLGTRLALRTLRVDNTLVEPDALEALNALLRPSAPLADALETLELSIAALAVRSPRPPVGHSHPLVLSKLPNLARLVLHTPWPVEMGRLEKLREAAVDASVVGQVWPVAQKIERIQLGGWRWGELGGAGAQERWEVQRECWKRGVGWVVECLEEHE